MLTPLSQYIWSAYQELKTMFHEEPPIGWLTGALGGIVVSSLSRYTGPMTALHEIVGHGLLGYYLTTDYTNGTSPRFEVYPINISDDFLRLLQVKSLQEARALLLSGKIAGRAYPGVGELNWIGKSMGEAGHSAWVSLSGSLPELFLDSAIVMKGISLSYRHPMLGGFITGFGICSHLMNWSYSLTALFFNVEEMHFRASQGHDFANFALQMAKITGFSPQKIAVTVAITFLVSVPLAALTFYAFTKENQIEKAV